MQTLSEALTESLQHVTVSPRDRVLLELASQLAAEIDRARPDKRVGVLRDLSARLLAVLGALGIGKDLKTPTLPGDDPAADILAQLRASNKQLTG